jgi:hypothetical protein
METAGVSTERHFQTHVKEKLKIKLQLSLYATSRHIGRCLCPFLTLALHRSDRCHAPAALSQWKQPPWYPLNRGMGGLQNWSRQFGENKIPSLNGNEHNSLVIHQLLQAKIRSKGKEHLR